MVDLKIFSHNRVAVILEILFKTQAARTILWVDILLPEIKRFHKMTVSIDDSCHGISSLDVIHFSHCRDKLLYLRKEFVGPVRSRQHI